MVSTMSPPLSPEVSGLLNQLSELSRGLENGLPGAREGRMQTCGALVSELAYLRDPSGCCSGRWWVSGSH